MKTATYFEIYKTTNLGLSYQSVITITTETLAAQPLSITSDFFFVLESQQLKVYQGSLTTVTLIGSVSQTEQLLRKKINKRMHKVNKYYKIT